MEREMKGRDGWKGKRGKRKGDKKRKGEVKSMAFYNFNHKCVDPSLANNYSFIDVRQ